MRRSQAMLLLLILICFVSVEHTPAQISDLPRPVTSNGAGQSATTLQPGIPIDQTIAPGQTQSFTISLDPEQAVELVVDQRGVDVVVRTYAPDGKRLGEYDTPNGAEGPENLTVVAMTTGVYRIDVTPLDEYENTKPGRYEIKIADLRHATEQELQAAHNQEGLKAKGLALLGEVARNVQQIHLPQTRVRIQLQAAQILWTSDEKAAGKLIADATAGVKAFIAGIDVGDRDYFQNYQIAMQLRREVIQVLAPHDPAAALSFLRATRTLEDPNGGALNGQPNQELQLELTLVSQVAAKDPKRGLEMAEESLKKGYSPGLVDTVARMRMTDPESAAKLAKEIAAKLDGDKLIKTPEAANLAVALLRFAHSPVRRIRAPEGTTAPANVPLLSDQEYRDLLQKALTEGLSYSAPPNNTNWPERNAAQNILNSLKSMTQDIEGFAPGSMAAIDKKIIELNTSQDPNGAVWAQFQNTLNTGTVDSAMEFVNHAPAEMRDQFYQQVASKAANTGDFAGARQILQEHMSNPYQRRMAMTNLDQQAIYLKMSQGKIEEAMQDLTSLPASRERTNLLSQIIRQIGPGVKRAKALALLELVRSMVGAAGRAEDQEQMIALIEIGRAFSRYDSKRGFEIIEPLVDQFNDLSAAALVLNGFGQQFYQDGELIMQNGNSVSNAANQLLSTLGTLGLSNFDRAKTDADNIHLTEVRLNAYLAIAQQAIRGSK